MNKRKIEDKDEKMDCFVTSNTEKEAIFKIYRSCRLCGAGAGYKMPIIQNVVDLANNDMELKDKIRECVQIEVNQDDKMPPLICELCVDKVQDFYDFLMMCKRTNKRTRLRLGLPQAENRSVRETTDTSDCILGITEPVFVKTEPNTNQNKKSKTVRGKDVKVKETEVKVKTEKPTPKANRELRELLNDSRPKPKSAKTKKPEPEPPRLRGPKPTDEKPETVQIENSQSNNRLKRTREKEPPKKQEVQSKKIKTEPPSPRTTRTSSVRTEDDEKLSSLVTNCKICGIRYQSVRALTNHMRVHDKIPEKSTKQTSFKCAKCSNTISSHKELDKHTCAKVKVETKTEPELFAKPKVEVKRNRTSHKVEENRNRTSHKVEENRNRTSHKVEENRNRTSHKVEEKRNRTLDKVEVKTNRASDKVEEKRNRTFDKVADKKNSTLNKLRVKTTRELVEVDTMATYNCKFCSKPFSKIKSVKAHQSGCKKRNSINVSPAVRERLMPVQIRTTRCDPLLARHENGHYDVSDVICPYGLDKNCTYPYQATQHNSLLSIDKMVDISEDITISFELEDYVHWDSDNGSDSDPDIFVAKRRKVESLTTLTLKTIFSDKCLGKVPKKRRKVKVENAFDSILNTTETDSDFRLDIDSILHNLGDEEVERDSPSIKILNVFSQKEMDYDSDRTSFNDDFDAVQSKDSNQTSIYSSSSFSLTKSILSKVTDLNDETSTNSVDSSLEERSILENMKDTFNDNNEIRNITDDTRKNVSNSEVSEVKKYENIEFDKVESLNDKNYLDRAPTELNTEEIKGQENSLVEKEHSNSSEVVNNETIDQNDKIIEDGSNNIDEDNIHIRTENKEINHNSKETDSKLSILSKKEENECAPTKDLDSVNEEISKENDSNLTNCEKEQMSGRKKVGNTDKIEINTSGDDNSTKSKNGDELNISDNTTNENFTKSDEDTEIDEIKDKNINSDSEIVSKLSTESSEDISRNQLTNKVTRFNTKCVENNSQDDSETVENSTNDHTISENIKSEENVTENANTLENIREGTNSAEDIAENTCSVENIGVNLDSLKNILQDTNSAENINESMDNEENINENTNSAENINESTDNVKNVYENTNSAVNISESTDNVKNINENINSAENISERLDNVKNMAANTNGEENFSKNGVLESDKFDLDDLEDVSDTEIEDNILMNDINDKSEHNDKMDKITLEDLLIKTNTDLDSISDGEFTLDD